MALRISVMAAVATVTAAIGSPAHADDAAIKSAHDAILAGNLDVAERTLSAERRIFPRRAEVLINLAAVYASSGRTQDAALLYRTVLSQPDQLMDLSAERTARTHAIADAGLVRLRYLQTASR